MNEDFVYDQKYQYMFELDPSCLMPNDAYLFIPDNEDTFVNNKDRLIFFGGINYREEEIKALEDFFHLINSNHLPLFDFMNPPKTPSYQQKAFLLKFIFSAKFQIEKVYEFLQKHHNFLRDTFPVQLTDDTFELVNSGILYSYGRDKSFRPIIYGNFDRMIGPKKYELEEMEKVGLFVLNTIERYMFLNGQVENWICIMDLHYLGVSDIPTSFIKKMIDTFQNGFKARMFKMFIVNATILTNVVYKIATLFMDPVTSSKLKLYRKPNPHILLDYIDRDQLLEEYGGNVPHPSKYWPPSCPSNNFGTDKSKLMSISDYKKQLLSNQLMEPRSDYSEFVRENRKKPGILYHKNFNLKGVIEKRDSYNGIIKEQINVENFFEVKETNSSKNLKQLSSRKSNMKSDEVDLSDILVENKIDSDREENIILPVPMIGSINTPIKYENNKYSNQKMSVYKNPYSPRSSHSNEPIFQKINGKNTSIQLIGNYEKNLQFEESQYVNANLKESLIVKQSNDVLINHENGVPLNQIESPSNPLNTARLETNFKSPELQQQENSNPNPSSLSRKQKYMQKKNGKNVEEAKEGCCCIIF